MLGSGDLDRWHLWLGVCHGKDDMRWSLNKTRPAGEVCRPYIAPTHIHRSSAAIRPMDVSNLGGSTITTGRRVCDLGAERNTPLSRPLMPKTRKPLPPSSGDISEHWRSLLPHTSRQRQPVHHFQLFQLHRHQGLDLLQSSASSMTDSHCFQPVHQSKVWIRVNSRGGRQCTHRGTLTRDLRGNMADAWPTAGKISGTACRLAARPLVLMVEVHERCNTIRWDIPRIWWTR